MNSDFRRLEYAIQDAFADEPISLDIAEALPYPGAYPVGVILTDLYADEPGQGTGSKVLPILIDMCHEAGWPVYLSPACADSRRFYERHGFTLIRDYRYGLMANYPPAIEWASAA